ncbi:non-canonical purine NTP diphosphatase [Aureitalea marina]|uniref:dITP/XTP pyrophosphatase n=1 Tax=Aureitalea marina TaxID=930804 RepID=A0A2S7KPL8_9FLAO|nr:non-canonical purine NTP diphosphatase [Aureitalea marina]PQB04561.1 non-canonical purine NTP pyrophosphatase [Aureitalea marina]
MQLVFATHNPNKLQEVRSIMPSGIDLLGLTDIGCHEEIPETSDTIEGNAELKAAYVRDHYKLPCFADDTGLLVDELGGAPGVYSARYAGPQKNALDNTRKLLKELADKEDRSAHFKTVIALALPDHTEFFTGICEGIITETPRGEKGFGYDPVFLPDGRSETFAEMTADEKADIGHRGKAVRALLEYLRSL